MSDNDVRISTPDEGVLEIVLNRPEAGNALTPAMTARIAGALATLDPDTRVVLLRAEGPDFCTGRAAGMPPKGTKMTANDLRALISDPVLDFYAALREVPVPVIAAVQGKAAGVGCAVAVLADVAVAGSEATFVVPEMNMDIAPTLVMDALCDRLTRAAFARMVLTRDPVGAAEAQMLGLCGVVAPEADPLPRAREIVTKLAENSAATVRAVKAFLIRAPESSHATRKELAALLNATATAEKFR